MTTRLRPAGASCDCWGGRRRRSSLRIFAPTARSLPTPRKSIQPKPPPMVWSCPPSGPPIPSVALRFSHGGWPIKKPRKRPPSVPPTPLLPLSPLPSDSSSSSYTPSTKTTMPGQNHAESSGMATARLRSKAMVPVKSLMARSPVGKTTS
ncbi:hypothetical protein G6O67_003703 [Ophiocordyceps sinensis]|uniref:Uncharacterized protein n=1 Tax=Ophiocordyceps sinensis TaxID=72228 RepID=A0A8H4PSG2_9HYPO|nr:hypothetical protein G6O67_003703 [Ophiocordyceps sinensis]